MNNHNRSQMHRIARPDERRWRRWQSTGPTALGLSFPAVVATLQGNLNRRLEMPPQYYVRRRGSTAICFHCRTTQRLDRDWLYFIEHYDCQRTGDNGGKNAGYHAYWNGIPKLHQYRKMSDGTDEICPGSGTAPIPIAHEFPEGTRLPRWQLRGMKVQ
jgi:hypothetical protein